MHVSCTRSDDLALYAIARGGDQPEPAVEPAARP